MGPRLKGPGHLFRGQKGPYGHPSPQTLGQGDYIRGYAKGLMAQQSAQPAHTSLNLIQNEQKAQLPAEVLHSQEILPGRDDNPPFPLNHLQHHSTGPGSNRPLQGLQIPVRHVNKTGGQGLKTLLHLLLSRSSHGHHGPAVEGTPHGDNLIALPRHEPPGINPGKFYGPFVGLGPRVAEENPVGKGMLHKHLSQFNLGRDVIEVRYMEEASGLLLDGFHHPGMTVAQVTHGYTRPKIQVLLSLHIPDPGPLPPLQDQGITAVCGHEIPVG